MNEQELFLVILAALIIGNIVNKVIFNPLIYKLQNALFGNGHEAAKRISGTAQSKSKPL